MGLNSSKVCHFLILSFYYSFILFCLAIRLTDETFTVDNDLLTPTFKLKRPQLLEKFKKEVDAMYVDINKMEAADKDKEK
jgi:hypothetical protein